MFDLGHIPTGADVQYYWGKVGYSSAFAPNTWEAWTRPPGARFVYILAIGGGGGGGGGRSAAVGTGKGGGGGGASGAIAQALYLAATIPDRLYVGFPANGTGLGGAAGTDGSVGLKVYVSVYNGTTTAQNAVLCVNNEAPAGSGSTGTGGGAGGGIPGATITSSCPLVNKALFFSSSAGRSGGAGGGTAAPANVVLGTTSPILGGCGGGSYQAAGSAYDGAGYAFNGYIPNIPGGANGGVTAGAGQHGLWLPPYHFGGTGGGGTNDALSTGGRGGDGIAPGAGGGGGGAGVTGGRGGNGGPGLVVIAAW